MTIRVTSRKVFPVNDGQARLFVSATGSSIVFDPFQDCYALTWSTKDPAVLELRDVLKRELTESRLVRMTVLLGHPAQTLEKKGKPENIQKFFDAADAFERDPNDPANQISCARFDFPTRAIELAEVEPNFKNIGISYLINCPDGRPADADIEALRRAFLDTAEASIKPELDWAIESIVPK